MLKCKQIPHTTVYRQIVITYSRLFLSAQSQEDSPQLKYQKTKQEEVRMHSLWHSLFPPECQPEIPLSQKGLLSQKMDDEHDHDTYSLKRSPQFEFLLPFSCSGYRPEFAC